MQYSREPGARVALRLAGTIALFLAGWMFGVFALSNVPGAISPDGVASDGGVLAFLVVTAAWVSVFWRRRAPIVVALAGAVVAAIGSEYLLLLIGAYAVIVRGSERHARRARIGAPAIVALFAVREALGPWGGGTRVLLDEPDGAPALDLVAPFVVAALSLLVFFGAVLLARTRQRASLAATEARLERGRADRLDAELERKAVRERIARDLHDTLAHSLATISFRSGAAERAAAEGDPRAAEYLRALRAETVRASDQLSALVNELRTPEVDGPLGPSPTMNGIADLVRAHRASGVELEVMILLVGLEGASDALQQSVYRIVQEGLTNAVKHAPGQPSRLFLDGTPADGIRIRIENAIPETPGHLSGHGSGSGTAGMRERVEQAGGTVWIGEHQGWFIVDATLPWSVPEPGRD